MATQGMTARRPVQDRRWLAVVIVLLAVGALATLSLLGYGTTGKGPASFRAALTNALQPDRPDSTVPVIEPLVLDASRPEEARQLNAAIPFSTAPNPAAYPYVYNGDALARERATDCLAAAMLYEAGDDTMGERAVGQVVLNRLRHPAFPKTVCGVVFQGAERATGCQFTFTCDGAMGRAPSAAAWQRARILAYGMLAGDVFRPVGHSTHYHTDWVMPYWSKSLDKVIAVGTHLFFRWQGWWGTPGAFVRNLAIAQEPEIARLAALSPAHRPGQASLDFAALNDSLINDSTPAVAIGPEMIGSRVGPGRLLAIEPGGNGFVMVLDKGGDPGRYAQSAARLCAGRAQCRLLAWTDPAAAPQAFPIPESRLASMSFSYIRLKDSNLERTLFNCDEFSNVPRVQCMSRRVPVAQAPRLLADEQADQVRVQLPQGARPVADMQAGQLQPTGKPRPRLEVAPGAIATGAH